MASFKTPSFKMRQLGGISVSAVLTKNDLERYLNIEKKTGARRVLGQMADDYLEFVHNRHMTNASGAGKWAALSKRTIYNRRDKYKDGKKRRHSPPIKGINAILIDQGQLLGATAPNGRGQVRRLDVNSMTIRAGIDGTTVYYDPRLESPRPRRSLGQLAKWAADGQPGGNKRRIIVSPDSATKTKFRQRLRAWFGTLNV